MTTTQEAEASCSGEMLELCLCHKGKDAAHQTPSQVLVLVSEL